MFASNDKSSIGYNCSRCNKQMTISGLKYIGKITVKHLELYVSFINKKNLNLGNTHNA